MIPDNYLRNLRAQLKGFSAQKQGNLIEEIGTHFESGENDPALGQDPEQRKQKVLSEMGSPKQMGQWFRDIHRPGRLIDYLLILVPTLVVFYFFISIGSNIFDNSLLRRGLITIREIYIRVAICFFAFCILMVVVSYVRRSLYLKLYWITILGLWLAYLPGLAFYNFFGKNTQESGYCISLWLGLPSLTFSFAWLAPWAKWIVPSIILLILLFVVLRMIWHVRHDLLTVVYAGLLVIWGIWAFYQPMVETSVSALFQHYYHTNPYLMSSLASIMRMPSFAGLFYGISFISFGIFFLIDKREIRWWALIFYVGIAGIPDLLATKVSVFWIYILLNGFIFPMGIVLTGWYLEKRRKVRWQSAL
jgi:hypothetical protein